jgi:nitroreductase
MSPLNVAAPQTLDLLLSRRSGSAKRMKGPGPSDDQIRTLICAASRVPDHGKLTPWRFLIFKGDARAKFGEVLAGALQITEPAASEERLTQERARFLRAPVIVGVVSRYRDGTPIPEVEQLFSAGAACQTLCIAAHAMGFVANWITEWCAYSPAIREALGLERGERIAGFVYLGHPAEPLEDRPRPAFEQIAKEWTPSGATALR